MATNIKAGFNRTESKSPKFPAKEIYGVTSGRSDKNYTICMS